MRTRSIRGGFAALIVAASATLALADSPAELLSPAAPGVASEPSSSGDLVLRSESFAAGEPIPTEHTCDGADRSPALSWEGVPEGTKAFAIVMEDPDAPSGTFTHWLAWNLPGPARALARGVVTKEDLGDGTLQGRNGFDRIGYSGPCPPKGRTHTYHFRLFALGEPLDLDVDDGTPVDRETLVEAAEEKALAEAELTGTYVRGEPTPAPTPD